MNLAFEKQMWRDVLPSDLLNWLQDDENVQKGYRNSVKHVTESDPQEIEVRMLVVDDEIANEGEINEGAKNPLQVLHSLAKNGPWMNEVNAMLGVSSPHLCSIEVHMHGRTTDGIVHVDDLNRAVVNVVIPLNDAYGQDRGGSTLVATPGGTFHPLACASNAAALLTAARNITEVRPRLRFGPNDVV